MAWGQSPVSWNLAPLGLFGFIAAVPRAKAPWAIESRPVGAVTLQDCSFARKGTTAGYQPDTIRRMGSHHFYHGRSRLASTTRQVVRAACAQNQSLLVLRFVILSSQNRNAPQLLCLKIAWALAAGGFRFSRMRPGVGCAQGKYRHRASSLKRECLRNISILHQAPGRIFTLRL